jgi:hypothetical protein
MKGPPGKPSQMVHGLPGLSKARQFGYGKGYGREEQGMAQAKRRGGSQKRSRDSNNGARSTGSKRSSQDFPDYSIVDPQSIDEGPDVLLDVPVVKVDEIDVEVDDLRARVSVRAEMRKLVQLNVGAEVHLGKVELNIQGVEAQALVKARLDNVAAILERVMLSLDRNPALLRSVGKSIESLGGGTGDMLAESGEAVEDVGEGTEKALKKMGPGAARGVSDLGRGAGRGVGDLGQGAGQGVGKLGKRG